MHLIPVCLGFRASPQSLFFTYGSSSTYEKFKHIARMRVKHRWIVQARTNVFLWEHRHWEAHCLLPLHCSKHKSKQSQLWSTICLFPCTCMLHAREDMCEMWTSECVWRWGKCLVRLISAIVQTKRKLLASNFIPIAFLRRELSTLIFIPISFFKHILNSTLSSPP